MRWIGLAPMRDQEESMDSPFDRGKLLQAGHGIEGDEGLRPKSSLKMTIKISKSDAIVIKPPDM